MPDAWLALSFCEHYEQVDSIHQIGQFEQITLHAPIISPKKQYSPPISSIIHNPNSVSCGIIKNVETAILYQTIYLLDVGQKNFEAGQFREEAGKEVFRLRIVDFGFLFSSP